MSVAQRSARKWSIIHVLSISIFLNLLWLFPLIVTRQMVLASLSTEGLHASGKNQDDGQQTFTGLTLHTAGAQSVPVADVKDATSDGTLAISVIAAAVDANASQISVTGPHRADGLEAATIVVTATDSSGNQVPGQTVWVVAGGTENTIVGSPGTTAANGVFSATMTSTQAEAKAIRILIGDGQTMTWLLSSPIVEFTHSSIAGTVFSDLNRDGVRQGDEPDLGGVQVSLYQASGTEPLKVTVTQSDGGYTFTGVISGDYRLEQTRLDQYAFSDFGVLTVTVGDFETSTGTDFGNYAAAQVSGQVWNDGSQDGERQGGEPPLPGVTIGAYDAGQQLVDSATSDADGAYQLDLAAGLPAAPDNFVFNSGRLTLQEPAAAVVGNGDFERGLTALDASTYPANYDFSTGDLGNWTVSDETYVTVVSDTNNFDGYHLLLNRYEQSAYSPAFVVPADAQSLRLDYFNWTERNSTEQSRLYVYALSGPSFDVSTQIGTLYGSHNQGWQTAGLDLQAFQGQTVRLRFRTDTDGGRNGRSRVDNVTLQVETPDWTVSDATYVRVVSDTSNLDGAYLLLNRYEQSAYSPAFVVPADAQSLRCNYFNWTERNSTEQSRLYVYALSGPSFDISTPVGTLYGSHNQGWQTAVLDLQAFPGQTVRLRFRTDTDGGRNGRSRIDNISLNVETPGWSPSNTSYVSIGESVPPADPGVTTPENKDFSLGRSALLTVTYPTNYDFARGLTALDASTYPANYDFASCDLGNWTVSDGTYVTVVSDTNNFDGYHLLLNRYEQSAYSPAFVVPADAQSLRLDYFNWTERDSTEQSRLYVYALSGPSFDVSTPVGTLYGSHNQGWQTAVLDLQAFQGQTVRLRFRTDTDGGRNGRSRVDNVTLQVEAPDWTVSDATYVGVVSDTSNLDGAYLLLNRYEQSAYSPAFVVPADTQSLRLDYFNWTERNSTEQSRLYVYALSGPSFDISTPVGTLYGSHNQGWQTAVLDLQAFPGQTVRLRFRTDTDGGRNGRSRIDNISLNVETPGWATSDASLVSIYAGTAPADPGLTAPENADFDAGLLSLPAETYPTNYDFAQGLTALDASTYPANYDFSTGDLGGWTVSDETYVTVVSDTQNLDGYHLLLNRYEQSAYSPAFVVPSDAQSLRCDYFNWTERDSTEQSRLYVYALSGPSFDISTQVGTLYGSHNQGWQAAVLDLQAFQGQTVRLRFRTDTNSGRNGRSRVDNVTLQVEVPDWTVSDATYVRVVSDTSNLDGAYLLLNRYDQSAYSPAFVVPADTQSLRLDYFNWTERNSTEQSRLYVYALSGPSFDISTPVGTLYGSHNQGWQTAVLDLQAFPGQTVRLRFRTDTDGGRNGRSRIDNISLNIETPGWATSNASYASIESGDGISGTYLYLDRYDISAYSTPFLVPTNTASLRLDYSNWTERDSAEQSRLYVYVLSGENFQTATQIGTAYGSQDEGWRQITLDLVPFQGRVIELRFRTDTDGGRNGKSRIDNVTLVAGSGGSPAGNDINPGGDYLYLKRYDVSAYSTAFLVPTDTDSVQFDYLNWTNRNAIEQSRLYVYVLSGENFQTSTQIDTAYGSQDEGWRQATLDLTAFRGQVVRLRFRTDTNGGRNGKSRIDNVALVPPGTGGGSPIPAPDPGGAYLYLGRYDVSAYSAPLLVPTTTQSLRFDYLNWTNRNSNEQSRLYVYILSGPDFGASEQIGTVYGSHNEGWQEATLDLTAYQDQVVKLRLRTDADGGRNGQSKIDDIYLLPLSTVPYTITEINPPNYTSTTPDEVGVAAYGGAAFTIDFGDYAVDRYRSSVEISPTILTADGVSAAVVTVTLRDGSDNPLSGYFVEISAPGTAISITQPVSPTNTLGQTTGAVRSTRAQSTLVTARTSSDNVTLAQAVPITFTPDLPDPDRSTFVASPTTVVANGSDAAAITVVLRDRYDNFVPGKTVTVTTDGTAISLTLDGTQTDALGRVTGSLRSTQVQTVTLRAVDVSDGITLTQPAVVRFTSTDPQLSSVVAAPDTLVADGVSTAVITVTLRDQNDAPLPGKPVILEITGDQVYVNGQPNTGLVPIGSSGPDGTVTAVLTSTAPGLKTISAYGDDIRLDDQAQVTFNVGPVDPALSQLETDRTTVVADGAAYATLTATLYDSYDHPVPGKVVLIQSTGDVILTQPATTTDDQGRVQATLRSTTVQTVTASAFDQTDGITLTQTATLAFVAGPADPAHSTIVITPTTRVADGVQTATITATLRDALDHPAAGRVVQLVVSGSDNVITPASLGTTGDDGSSVFHLASTRAETKQVSLHDVGYDVTLPAGPVIFLPGPPDGGESVVWASPVEVAADGVTTATVHVRVYDAHHNPVPGVPVTLSDTGSSTVLTQPAEPTGADGRTQGAIRSATPQVVTLTATAGEVTISDTAQVTFLGANLSVTKYGPATALAGRLVTYTLTVVNAGELAASVVVLTDTLPEGMMFVTHTAPYSCTQDGRTLVWQLGSLAQGTQASFDLAVTVAPTVAHRTELTNQTAAASATYEVDTSDNTATATTLVYQPEPDLAVTPSYSELALQRGAAETVILTVKNAGTAAAGELTVLSSPHLTWVSAAPTTLPGLMPGESATVTVTLAPPGDLAVGTYRDVTTVQMAGTSHPQAGMAFSVRVVGITRTLAVSVSDSYGVVAGASVHLVRREESLLVTEGVLEIIHQEAQAQTGGAGVALLEDLEVGAYDYTVSAAGHGAASGVVTVTAGSGTQAAAVTLEELPLLVPEPLYPEIHVRPGETAFFEAAIRNAGLGTATNVRVTPPEGLDWLSVGVNGSTNALEAGKTLSVTIAARPPVTLTAPSVYREYVTVTADNAPDTRLALTVYVSSQETSTMQVRVTVPGGTPLEGAQVTLVSKESILVHTGGITQATYERFVGETSAGGMAVFEGIPAGGYNYYVEADGYEPVSVDPYCGPGQICTEDAVIVPLPFDVTWSVEETEITDVYSATVNLTFEADRLQLLPLDIVAPCAGGSVSGVIEVRNPSPYPATNVQVWGEAPGVSLQVSGQGATIAGGQVAQFPFTAQVSAWARSGGWITAEADDVDGNRTPLKVSTECTSDGSWGWGWGGSGGGIIGTYRGSRPSFPNMDGSPFQEPTILRLKLSQRIMLERQAFLATLVLDNTGGEEEITGVQVRITARDANGVSQPTHFVITPTVPTALPDLLPGGEVVQQWLVVPADLGITAPATYALIATLVYSAGGVECEVVSFPELIVVQPQPEVHVEYFLPEHVRAGEPVLLGVKAENRGYGTARNLRIESAYPEIVSQQGRPVSFEMLGTFEDGALQAGDMLLDFGDVPPGETVLGGWLMTFSPYHGRFTELSVQCEHLDYQGMQLSTLIYCQGEQHVFDNDLQYLNDNECPDASASDKQGTVGGPINTRSGNYGYQTLDLSIPTAAQPLRMERSYNSSNVFSDTDTLSSGWTHQYAMRLEFPDMSSGTFFAATTDDPVVDRSTIYYRPYVLVRLPGGSRLRLADNGDGTFSTYPGAQTTLAAQETGGVVTYTLTAADQTARIFAADGRLRAIRDRRGNKTELTYDYFPPEGGSEGGYLLTRVTGPTGLRWLDFGYENLPPGEGSEGGWRLVEVRDSAGRAVGYGYDSNSNLAVVTDTQGLTWTYTYTPTASSAVTGTYLLYEVLDPAGNLVERTDYDATGRAVYQEDGAGIPLALAYDEHATTVAEAGRERVHQYDFFGALVGQVDPAGQTQVSSYNWDFRRDSMTDALGRKTDLDWNSCCGQLTAITDTLGHTTQLEYDGANNLTGMTDAAGNTTTYEYDESNNLVATTNTLSQTVRQAYDEFGHVISTTDVLGKTTFYGYDDLGQRVAVTDTLGHATTYGYNAVGRLITTTAHTGLVTVNAYDDGDNLMRSTRNYTTAGGQNYLNMYNLVTAYGYDEVGRRVATTDTLSHVARSEYDTAGRRVRSWRNYLPGHPQNYQDTYNLVTEYGYDLFGHQALVTNTLGSVSFTEYDELDRVARSWRNYLPGYPQNYTPPSPPYEGGGYNLVTEYGYDAVGNQIMVTDTVGSVTFTEYDELNRPVTVTTNYVDGIFDPASPDEDLQTVTGYDVLGNRASTTNAQSQITKYEYDDLNRPVTVTTNYVDGVFDPATPDEDLMRVTTYDATGRVQQVTDHASRITFYEYDELGRQVAVIQNYQDGAYDPAQPDQDLRSETIYNELGQVAARVQVAETVIPTYYAYDVLGRLITTTNALSGTTVTRYDVLGRRVETVDAKGHATRYGYDAAGRLITTTNALSGATVTTYDALGRRVRVTDPESRSTSYGYDTLGRTVAITVATGAVTHYGYDVLGRRTVSTDADGVGIYSVYDNLGRLIETRDALSNSTQYGYDTLGNRTELTDANGMVTRYEHDDLGRLTTVIENYQTNGLTDYQTNLRTEYTYDVLGNMTVVENALGHTTVYTYDLAGRRVAEADPLGNVTEYQYDGHGRRVGAIYPDASGPLTVTTGYNALGRPTQIDYPAIGDVPGFTVAYSYDALGHRDVVTDATGMTTYDYDALYQPLAIDAPTGAAHYTYNAAGQRTNLVYPGGEVVTYTHDAASRLHTVTDWAGGVTVYIYTAAGRLSGMQLPNGVTTQYGYDAAGRLVELEHRDGNDALLARYTYTLDGLGNRVRVEETIVQLDEEPHGPGDVTVTVRDTDGNPETGRRVYVFDDTTYTGYHGTTNVTGTVTLAQLPEGSYRFRADKNGVHFWSGDVNHCAVPVCASAVVTTTIPLGVTVEDTDGAPEEGLKVYAFDDTTYTGYNQTTDASGQAVFTLPQGDYRFRSDKNGTQFWSGEANHCTVPGCTSTTVTTTIPLTVLVADTNDDAESGLKVYAFEGATYTGYNQTTDASGQAVFTLPQGDYRFRSDKNGTHFWSGETNHCTVPGCMSTTVTTTIPLTVTVKDTNDDAESGLKVYAFEGATYTGYNQTTDASGQAVFTLPLGDYRFRSDKNGTHFWSGESNHCTVPGCTSTTVTTTIPLTVTVRDTDGNAENGLHVYAFDDTTYTGYNQTTDASGQAVFTLPQGDYRFRSDKNGTHFWSGESNHCTVPGCTSTTVTTTIPVAVSVRDSAGGPEAGLNVYGFDDTIYTGYNGATDVSGLVTFTLPLGDYRFRADKDGTHFWSGETNHCTVPGCTSAAITTTTPGVTVVVVDTNGDPAPGLPVYAFDGTTYSGYHGTTNISGTLTLLLPEGNYRFRADKNGAQFWSGATNHCTVPGCASATITTTIPVVVTIEDTNGDPEQGLPVYAFDGASYTGYHKTTDASGQAVFTLPQGDYRFRSDKNGAQFWSGETNHCTVPGCTSTTVTTTIPLTVLVEDTNGAPEEGLKVYAFEGATYTGYNKTTDASGQAVFTLPQGDYRFRSDKNGTQFWSGATNHCTVPGCTSTTVTTTIPLTVTVKDTNDDAESGLKVYAFEGTTYTGYNQTTDASGQAVFTLPQGDYRFRADKNGTQFWSGESNHCTLPGCTSTTVTTTVPVVVTVEDGAGDPEPNLPVYAFDETTYTGYHGTTDVSGTVTLTLPQGDYRFRVDKSGEQYWSGSTNHCTVPGCAEATITVGSQALKMPTGVPTFAKVETLPDPSSGEHHRTAYRPPGLAAVLSVLPESLPAQSGETVTVTRVITYVYDPLNRLTGAQYSTAEAFEYKYDAVGNRTALTSTTPLSGTVVTTYTYDIANRLTARAVSDGRAYTYDWSDRGQLLVEWTQGYPVRTFTYDGAGQMVAATLFTQTTRFRYNGLGARVAVEVVGYGTTTVTLDLAAGNRILAEETISGTTLYLYGKDCLGEFRAGEPLYYLPDAEGLVRQGTDDQGDLVSTWLFDPDGALLEGPDGPVSHLVCGGVYDWSTGLLYKGGRYFDPMLGIWLALLPLIVVRRKKKRRGYPWVMVLALCLGGMSGVLTACGPGETPIPICTPKNTPTPGPPPEQVFENYHIILACGLDTNCPDEVCDYAGQVPLQPIKYRFVDRGGDYTYLGDETALSSTSTYATQIVTEMDAHVDSQGIFLVGHSRGATAAVWAASISSHPKLKAIAILDSYLLDDDHDRCKSGEYHGCVADGQKVMATVPMFMERSNSDDPDIRFPVEDVPPYPVEHKPLAVNDEVAQEIINFFIANR